MRQSESYAQWFADECARAARLGHALMMRPEGTNGGLFLYYRRGEIRLMAEGEPGFELGEAQRAPEHLTVEQLKGWIHARASRLPCLPVASA